jgi:2-polyprenyl-6-methoxyphenol hydroxylase-like FAD-dependent oxidoreductase
MQSHSAPRDEAVVIGASIGGLLAARALADHFRIVTLLERDDLPAGAEHRKAITHGRHAHGLLAQGRTALEDLFPGLTDALHARGGLRGDLTGDVLWHVNGGPHLRFASGIEGLLVSRPLLEAEIRSRVLALPNVRVETGVEVRALLSIADGRVVSGLRCASRATPGQETERRADLVVDASGRGSRLPHWLKALGSEAPREERVKADLHYVTREYRRRPGDVGGLNAVVLPASPAQKRSAVLLAMEDDRWIMTLVGRGFDAPPSDEAGMRAFARSLATPEFAEIVERAEPVTAPLVYGFPFSQRRRYEQLQRFPRGLLAFGDSICSFNPVFGQGMTAAALEAGALRIALAGNHPELARDFFARAARIVDIAWAVVTGADARIHNLPKYNGAMNRFTQGYIDRVHRAARNDREVCVAFHRVANLMEAPPSLLKPRIALRVLRAMWSAQGDAKVRAPRYEEAGTQA